MKFLKELVLCCVTLSLGCGYSLVGKGKFLPPDIKSVYIEPFENKTRREELSKIVTRYITEELIARKALKVVSDKEKADSVLIGTIKKLDVIPQIFDEEGRATEYQVVITLSLLLKRPENSVIWESPSYIYRENYELDLDPETYIDREKIALQTAAQGLAKSVITDILEGF